MSAETYPQPILEARTIDVRVGWLCRCARCGELFESKRRDARACSPACGRALSPSRNPAPQK